MDQAHTVHNGVRGFSRICNFGTDRRCRVSKSEPGEAEGMGEVVGEGKGFQINPLSSRRAL